MAKILFLEDEPTIQEVTAEYMKMNQFDVKLAADGRKAMELLKTEKFDLAVLDIMVPYITGLEVLTYIKEQFPTMGTIMLTALEDEQTQVKAFNLCADDYVIKPFSPLLLIKRMESILRRLQQHEVQMNCSKDEIQLQEESYQAFYHGESLGLTVSEFLLLQTLMEHKKRVFTREQLIMQIFNEDYVSNERIIDAHVKNLRKKLPKNCIKTVIGAGYQYQTEE